MAEQLAVIGSPIAHSQSPALHLAAYRVLGLDWQYSAIEVDEPELAGFLNARGRELRGLSVTMPLKTELVRLADVVDPVARLATAANTAIWTDGALQVFNTDVAGIQRALAEHGVQALQHAVLLGGGATAGSALIALAELGVESVDVRLRNVRKAGPLIELGRQLGVMVLVDELQPERAERAPDPADALLSTLPAHAADAFAAEYADCAPLLFDVAYAPWPSLLAQTAQRGGATVLSGLEMLLQQALIQVRIFVSGDPLAVLPDETAVLAAMRAAIPALGQS